MTGPTTTTKDRFAAIERMQRGKNKAPPRDPLKAVLYARKSTDDAALSLDVQARVMVDYAKRNGLAMVGLVKDEGVSGGLPLDQREGLIEAIDLMRLKGAGVLLVARRDRLARDAARALIIERTLERDGARIVTADGIAGGESPEDKLLRSMLDLFAEYERALIKIRTRSAIATKRRNGDVLGQVPFGYRASGGKLMSDPAEQRTIAFIVELREREGKTYDEITEALKIAGYKPRGESGRWHRTTVTRIYDAFVRKRAYLEAEGRKKMGL
jgi:DNA invertase Pin-like site-specific DNA recombinase